MVWNNIHYAYQFFLKDLPSGDSLFDGVPKDVFDHIPKTLTSTEEQQQRNYHSRIKRNKCQQFGLGWNNQLSGLSAIGNRDPVLSEANILQKEGNFLHTNNIYCDQLNPTNDSNNVSGNPTANKKNADEEVLQAANNALLATLFGTSAVVADPGAFKGVYLNKLAKCRKRPF